MTVARVGGPVSIREYPLAGTAREECQPFDVFFLKILI
jgi:hypothetical protein